VTCTPPLRARLTLVVLSGAVLGCGRPPERDLDMARAAMARAAAAQGAERAPDLCSAARSALVRAEAEVQVQTRRSTLRRDYDEAERLALQARLQAETCAYEAGAAQARTRVRAEKAIADLAAALPRVSSLARHVSDGDIGEQLLQVEIALGEAKTAFDTGRFERAEEAAERGRAGLATVVAAINRLFDAYDTSPRRGDWSRWVRAALHDSDVTGGPVILIDKLRRELLVYRGKEELATYPVDLGIGGMNSKVRAGDDATPEGRYRIVEVRAPGQTRYYRALLLDYPNAEDLARFRKLKRAGRVSRQDDIGSLIEIHGNGGRSQDWTKGCVALDNDDMDDLVPRVRVGTEVTIVGTIPGEVLP
jgi:L,D-transpeptidase-like protein